MTNQFHLLQCYSCQEFGHKRGSEKCSAKAGQELCLYCAENHMSRNCPSKKDTKKHKCANCLKANNIANEEAIHPSNSVECPILQSALKSLVNRTMGCNMQDNISKNEITI